MKKLLLFIGLLFICLTSYSQDQNLIKQSVIKGIKSDLLAPSTFKLERYEYLGKIKNVDTIIIKDLIKEKQQELNLKNQNYLNYDPIVLTSTSTLNLYQLPDTTLKCQHSLSTGNGVTYDKKDNINILNGWLLVKWYDNYYYVKSETFKNDMFSIDQLIENLYENQKDKVKSSILSYQEILLYCRSIKNYTPLYEVYVVYQCMTKGGTIRLFDEYVYINKKYKFIGNYDSKKEIWDFISEKTKLW